MKAKNPEKFEPEYAVPEDKPNKFAAYLKIQHTGVYADIHVEKGYNPLPRVSDDELLNCTLLVQVHLTQY